MKKWVLPTIVGTSSLLVGGGIATGIILPKTLKLKDGLSNFVPGDGSSPMRSWNAQKKLNYVALGDSETAGFNGFLQGSPELAGGRDYVSYADILANDLNKSGHLSEYHNYAVSGATIPDQQKMFGENQLIHKTIKEADLITLTVGANDLLSFVRLLDMPFKLSLDGIIETLSGKVVDYNSARDAIFGPNTIGTQSESPSAGPTREEGSEMLHKSINMLAEMVKTGNYNHIINLEEDFKEKVFDLIYRNFMMFVHDLREVAPHAQIVVLGHAMPFAQWPSKNVLDAPRADMGGQTIRGLYQKMITKMREGATFSLTGDNDYTSFLSVDDLTIKKSADGTNETDSRDGVGKRYTDYIKYDDADPQYYVRNAMPNAADIHPSTFGHQLIGNAVFDFIAPSLGISDSTQNYTYTQKFDGIYHGPLTEGQAGYAAAVAAQIAPFERIDENPALGHTASSILKGLLKGEGLMPSLLGMIIPSLTGITDFSALENLLSEGVIQKITEDMANIKTGTTIGKLVQLIADPANADTVKLLTDDLKKLLDVDEKSRALRDALLAAVDLIKSNNAASTLLFHPVGNLMADKHKRSADAVAPTDAIAGEYYYNTTSKKWMKFNGTTWDEMEIPKENKYDSIADYLKGKYGIDPAETTKADLTEYIDKLTDTFKKLLKVISPSFPESAIPSIDGFKAILENAYDTMIASIPSDASALPGAYAGTVAAIQQSEMVTIGTPTTTIARADLFNYMFITMQLNHQSVLIEGLLLPLMGVVKDENDATLDKDTRDKVNKELSPIFSAFGL